MTSLTLTLPDDWHIHLRDEAALATTVPDVARWAGRAIVMPNLTPPVLSVADALSYRERILAHVPEGGQFEPLMVLYLTDATTPEMVAEVAESPHVQGIKLYPAGATTNSDAGVTGIEALYPVFEAMERHDVPLLIHMVKSPTIMWIYSIARKRSSTWRSSPSSVRSPRYGLCSSTSPPPMPCSSLKHPVNMLPRQ